MTSLEGNKIKIIFSVMLSGRGGVVIWEKGKRAGWNSQYHIPQRTMMLWCTKWHFGSVSLLLELLIYSLEVN